MMDKTPKTSADNRIKGHLLGAAVAVLLTFVLCGALVYYVDPFFHYHGPLPGFPYVIDNQLTQNPGMAEHFNYDSVILGSSMTVNFETDDFRELMGLDTIKLSYSSAYPKDISNICEKIFLPYDDGREKEIRKVFLGLDIITYSGDTEETKYPIPKYLYDNNVINDVNYLLNKDVLLNYVLRPMADPEPTNLSHVYASWWTDDYYNEEWVLRNHVPPVPREDPMSPDAFEEPIRRNLEVNILPYINAHPETEFVIFFPPYSILFWDDVMRENHLEATLRAYQCTEEVLNGCDNVRMYFFPACEEIVTDLNNYADYSHYHPRYNRYMAECFASGECLIAKREEPGVHMEEYLDRMRKILKGYDFTALEGKLEEYHPRS